jgi:hypothetical protein
MEEFSEYELFILNKIAIKNRWCDKHISREDLLQGRKRSDLGLYGIAIDNLVKKGILKVYKAQGRDDYCLLKAHRELVISVLKENAGRYSFISSLHLERIR